MSDLILEIVEGPAAGQQVPLTQAVEAGRSPDVALSLGDDQASRRHARIEPYEGGAVVTDLDSSNGTYINDQPISQPTQMRPGDRVRIGLSVLELRDPAPVAAQPPAVNQPPAFAAPGAEGLRAPAQVDKKGIWIAGWTDIKLEHRPDLDVSALFIELEQQFGDRYQLSQRKRVVIVSETGWRGVSVLALHKPGKNRTTIRIQRVIPQPWNLLLLVPLALFFIIGLFIAMGLVLGRSKQIEGEVAAFLAQSPLIAGTKQSPLLGVE